MPTSKQVTYEDLKLAVNTIITNFTKSNPEVKIDYKLKYDETTGNIDLEICRSN